MQSAITLDYVSGGEKLKLVRELSVIRQGMPTAKGVNKLVLIKRIGEIRTLLLSVPVNNDHELTIDPNDASATLRSMASYIRDSVKNMPTALQTSELNKLQKIKRLVATKDGNHSFDDLSAYDSAVNEAYKTLPETDKSHVDLLEHYKAAGDVFKGDIEVSSAYAKLVEEEQKKEAFDTPEMKERQDQALNDYTNLQDKLYSLQKINSANGYSKEDIDKASEEYGAVLLNYHAAWNKYIETGREKFAAKQARIDSIKEQIAPIGRRVIDTLLSSSPVTKEHAESWANSQEISKSAENRLKKLGYPIADVRRDMAEFHRLSGGKLRYISIDSSGHQRANASGIGDVEGNAIHLGSRFDKSVLFHELAHHLEADPSAKSAANGFLIKRRKSPTVYSLRSLTGNKGFSKDEGAYQDEFITPYIGKRYSDGVTEVWSMGVQYLSSPEDAAMMLGKDPEMAALIAGYLQADITPAMKALRLIRDSAKSGAETKRNDQNDRYLEAINKLSKGVDIVDDGWFDGLESDDQFNILKSQYYGFGDPDAKFIGSWNGFRVFYGKFAKFHSRRKAKGYAVTWTLRTGTLLTGEDDGSGGSQFRSGRAILRMCSFHTTVEEMKAAMRVAEADSRHDIRNAYLELFYYNGGKEKAVNYAKSLLGNQE